MAGKLAGKVALVTGGSKGIGAGIARRLAAEGASVVVNFSRSKAEAEAVVSEVVKGGGKAVAVQADVSKPEEIDRMFAEAKAAFGVVDVLVNNAGVYEMAPISEVTPEFYRKQFDLNVLGLLLTTKAAVAQFGPRGGCVINISSIVATAALPNSSVYSATKAAVDSITRTLAAELGPKKVRVNAVNPGLIETEGTHSAGMTEGDMRSRMEAQTPLGRIGQPGDIAPAVAFLASDDASWITGETIHIGGGFR